MPENTGPHVAVLAFPFSTHAAPLLAVIRRLASATPNTIYSFFNTAKSNASIFKEQDSNIRACDVEDGVPEGYVFAGKPQEDIELFMEAAPDGFRKGMDAAAADTGRRVTCLVTDAFFWFAAEMAEDMHVPWLAFWTAGPASLSAHLHTDLLRQTVGSAQGIQVREDETLPSIPGMSKVRIKDLPEGVAFGRLDSLFSHMLHNMGRVLPKAAAVFLNCFEELDPTITNDLKSKLKNYLNVGPSNLIMKPPPSTANIPGKDSCLSWLDKQRRESVAYISFGSVTMPPQKEIMELAEALEASQAPFIWSLKDQLRVNLPQGFLERTSTRGLVVPWAPQEEILRHDSVGAFVTHCGWNSLLESMGGGGTAMICRPFFGDQRLNGRMIEDVWEIGVRVEGCMFTKEGVMSCLHHILSGERGRQMRDNIRSLRRLADSAVGANGSSTRNFKHLVDIVSRSPGAKYKF